MPVKKKMLANGRVRYYVETRSTGRRVYHRGAYATRREAEAALSRLKVAKDDGTYRAPDSETVETFLSSWIASHKNIRPRTRLRYEQVIRDHIVPVIGSLRVQRVRPEDVQRVVDSVEAKGLGAESVVKVASVMRAAFGLAVRRGRLVRNPASAESGVELPRLGRSKLQPPTAEDVSRILAASEGHAMHLPLTILAWSGVRRGEALGLRWSDVDLDAGELHIRRAATFIGRTIMFAEPKTERALRIVPLRAELVAELRRAKVEQSKRRLAIGDGWRDLDLVVDNGSGEPCHPDRLTRYFLRLVARLGMDVRVHDLRHAFASILLAEGVPVLDVSRILGHSSAAFTMDRYGHLMPRHADGIRAALDRAYASGGSPG